MGTFLIRLVRSLFVPAGKRGKTAASGAATLGSSNEFFDERLSYHDSLVPIETTVRSVLDTVDYVKDLESVQPASLREQVGVARHLRRRITALRKKGNCGRCWLQKAHCICQLCLQPLDDKRILPFENIFVLMHHKEVGLAVDTAKMIKMAFPKTCHLVIGGIDSGYQEAMKIMKNCLTHQPQAVLVLFPHNDALTWERLVMERRISTIASDDDSSSLNKVPASSLALPWKHLIVLDGTWEQARKLHKRYILDPYYHNHAATARSGSAPTVPRHIQLSDQALEQVAGTVTTTTATASVETAALGLGGMITMNQQLRRHPEAWRQISTLAAVRFLLQDIAATRISADDIDVNVDMGNDGDRHGSNNNNDDWNELGRYQQVLNAAAIRQLGPVRYCASSELSN